MPDHLYFQIVQLHEFQRFLQLIRVYMMDGSIFQNQISQMNSYFYYSRQSDLCSFNNEVVVYLQT